MKIKKIITFLLAFVLAFGMINTSAFGFSDISESEYKEEIAQLKKLEIINGYTDGTFGLNDNITRAEFAKMIADMLNFDVSGIDIANQFSDVPSKHWAYNAVGYVKAMGYMQGYPNGTFRPNDNITGNEVLIALCNVLGYRYRYEFETPFITANSLGLLKNVNVPLDSFITREKVAKLIYNALTIDVCIQKGAGDSKTYEVIKGDNILKLHHNIISGEGVITSNDVISIGTIYANENCIIVNSEEIVYDDYEVRKLVGYNIRYMYKIDDKTGKKILFHYEFSDNKIVTVDLDDFEGYQNNNFKFFNDTAKGGEVKISATADVFKNGEFFPLKSDSFDKIKEGEVTFISTNNNSVYDVIHITEYTTVIVNNVDLDTETIRCKLDKAKVIDLGDRTKTFKLYNSDKKEISLESIKENDVLTLVESSIYNEIYQCKETASDFTSYSTDAFYKGEKEYKINKNTAQYYNFNNFDYSQVAYLDIRGKLTFFLNKNFQGTIAYLIKLVDRPHPMENKIVAKYFTNDGEIKSSFIAKRVKINGKTYKEISFSELETLIKKDNKHEQMVLLNTDAEDNIISIETARPYADLRNNNENKFCEVMPLTPMACLVDSRSFDNKLLYENNTNPIMVIPNDVETADDDDYSIMYSKDLTNATSYNVAAYNLGVDYGICDVLMIKSEAVSSSIGSSYTALAVVKKKTTALTEDGERVNRVYVVSGKAETYFDYSNGEVFYDRTYSVDDLNAGDIIRYTASNDNKLSAFAIYYRYNKGGNYERVAKSNPTDNLTAGTEILLTTVERFDGKYVSIFHNPAHQYDYFMFTLPKNFHKVTVNGAGDAIVELGSSSDIQVGNKIILQLTYNQTMSITVIKD